MKTFCTYLDESNQAVSAFRNARKIADDIPGAKYKERYLASLDALEAAAQSKEIYTARFNDFKGPLMSGIEYGYRTMFDKIKDDLVKQAIPTMDLWSITSTTDINKLNKIYLKMNPRNKTAIDFMEKIKDIPDAMKVMKGYLKSGRPPAVPKPGQFIKPLATMAASKLAMQFMKDATNSFEKELRKNVTDRTNKIYDKIKNITNPSDLPKDDGSKSIATTIFILRNKAGVRLIELKSDSDKLIQRLIDDTVNGIIDGFVAKNTSKLALILQKKNTPKTHKILDTSINNGLVENSMSFEFEDSSSFVLVSTVIFKQSKNGKLFLQYPTRFMNVKMSDGSRMRGPSEEKMIKEF